MAKSSTPLAAIAISLASESFGYMNWPTIVRSLMTSSL